MAYCLYVVYTFSSPSSQVVGGNTYDTVVSYHSISASWVFPHQYLLLLPLLLLAAVEVTGAVAVVVAAAVVIVVVVVLLILRGVLEGKMLAMRIPSLNPKP